MSVNIRHIRIWGVLLAVVFLGAQFHYCADLSAGPSSSHICPLCSAAGSALTPNAPSITMVSVTDRLEAVKVLAIVSVEIIHAVSPRAPPAL
jgi:hypothetical protein